MKKRNRLTKISISLLIVLFILLLLVACDDSSELKYSVNDDGETCTITGIGKNKIDDLVIPEEIDGYTVVAIADNAFMDCNFKTVTLPKTLKQIGKSAFESCLSLEIINIPSKVTEIQERTFYGCTNLIFIKFPEGLTDIKDFAFRYCEHLESVEFPSTLINIGMGAFMDCTNLLEINLPEGLKKIDGYGFGFCYSLTEVYIPASVETLYAPFACCPCLKYINVDTFNEHFISIDGVLYDNTLRTLIQYPGGKTDPHFAMSANVRYINLWAFSGNGYLQSIDIPNNVQIINTEFLMYCPNVDTINYKGTISEWVSFEKRKNWNSSWLEYGYNYTIYCTDGQISKDGTVTYN